MSAVTPAKQPRVYLLSSTSIHNIREALQIILDFAENASSEVVTKQVHRIEAEISCQV